MCKYIWPSEPGIASEGRVSNPLCAEDRVTDHVARLRADLRLAKQYKVPVLIQVDTENWLPESLTNWYDPKKPGFNPQKVDDVEWYGWTPDTAVKLCWRNWGTVVRVGPHPNLLSPVFKLGRSRSTRQ